MDEDQARADAPRTAQDVMDDLHAIERVMEEREAHQRIVERANAVIYREQRDGDVADMAAIDAVLPEGALDADEAMLRQRAEAVRLRPLRDQLTAAMTVPRAIRVAYFEQQLREHRNHPEFRLADDPMRRLLGFSCTCGGTETLIQISLMSVRELMPQVLPMFQRIRNRHMNVGVRKVKKEQERANKKARDLLFKHLTRAQKWYFKAYGCIRFRGADGHEYEIEPRGCNNVYKLDAEGQRKMRYCVVFKGHMGLPQFDLMLAQMVTLKVDPEHFHDIAIKSEYVDYAAQYPRENLEAARDRLARQHRFQQAIQEGLDNLERNRYTHPEANLRRQLQDAGRGRPEILINDLVFRRPEGEEHYIEYDTPPQSTAYYLNWDDSIVATCAPRVRVPRLDPDDVDYAQAVATLLRAAACCTYDHYDEVLDHFRTYDLPFTQVLLHPDDEPVFVEVVSRTRWVPFITTDEHVTRGKALCLTSSEFLGVIPHWDADETDPHGRSGIGFAVFNNRGVVRLRVPRPPDEDEHEDVDDAGVDPGRPEGRKSGAENLPAPPLPGAEDLQGRGGREDGRPPGDVRPEPGEDDREREADRVREDRPGAPEQPGRYLHEWLRGDRHAQFRHRGEIPLDEAEEGPHLRVEFLTGQAARDEEARLERLERLEEDIRHQERLQFEQEAHGQDLEAELRNRLAEMLLVNVQGEGDEEARCQEEGDCQEGADEARLPADRGHGDGDDGAGQAAREEGDCQEEDHPGPQDGPQVTPGSERNEG